MELGINTETKPTSTPTPLKDWVVAQEMELERRTREMVDLGIKETEKKYGKESESPKEYHNDIHVFRMVEATEKIGEEEQLTQKEISLLRIAAAWHDVETGMEEENENISAKLCADEMRKAGWGEKEIEVVRRLILATKYFFKGDVIHQMVEEEAVKIDEYRLGLMSRIMADADISAAGAPWDIYEACGKALGKEARKYREDMTEEEGKEFWRWQLEFLDGLLNKRGGFYTQGARRAFPHMASNLEETRRKVSLVA